MHTVVHVMLNALIAFLAGGTPEQIAVFALGAAIIDLDHIIYFMVVYRSLDPKKMRRFFSKDFDHKKPHVYIFHTIEFHVLALLLSYRNPVLFVFFLGFTAHLIQDTINYVVVYRSSRPWSRYFFFTSFLLKRLRS